MAYYYDGSDDGSDDEDVHIDEATIRAVDEKINNMMAANLAKRSTRTNYSNEMKAYIAEQLKQTDFNIKLVCDEFFKTYQIPLHRSIVKRIRTKIKFNIPVTEKRGRKTLISERVQQLTQDHLVRLRNDSSPVTVDIVLYV